MKHNAYDFDKTIYTSDSTMDFYFYCLKRNPMMLVELPLTGLYFLRYAFRLSSKTEFKEKMFRFLRHLDGVDNLVLAFWVSHKKKMAHFYKDRQRPSDIIISATPEFLLKPICTTLGLENLIASRVDRFTGHYEGENCHGKEKVRRLKEAMPEAEIEEFYSDSLTDTPMAMLAEKATLVKNGRLYPWPSPL